MRTNDGIIQKEDQSSRGSVLMVVDTGPPNSDGLGIGEAFRRLGYRVSYFDFLRENPPELVDMARLLKPDIVFVTKGQGMVSATLRKVKEHTDRLVMWYPDAYLPEDRGYGHEFLADILPEFDVALINCRGLVGPLTRYNKECHFAPAYFDNHFFRIGDLTEQDFEVFGCDAVFIGNSQKAYGRERIALLRAVSRVCKLRVWGLGWGVRLPRSLISVAKMGLSSTPSEQSLRLSVWNKIAKTRPPIRMTAFSRAVMGRELLDNSLSKAYQCSKIGLNVGTLHLRTHGGIDMGFSDRLYECMGNGTPYVTAPIRNIEGWFEEGRELVTYASKNELVSEIQYLMENEGVRKDIGRSGREKIMRYHTIDIRIQQYLDMIYGKKCPFDCRHETTTVVTNPKFGRGEA